MTSKTFIKKHAVPAYFALTFAISWGGFLMVVGPRGFAKTSWQTDGRFPFAVLAMLAGPSVTGLLLTGLVDGKSGLREILRRLLMWRVGAGWYGVALLPAPLGMGSYDVCVVPHWDVSSSVVEPFAHPVAALRRHAEIACNFQQAGFSVSRTPTLAARKDEVPG